MRPIGDRCITAVCRSGYYQLRQLRTIARSLSLEAAKSLVQAFISSRLDYRNAILHGLPDRLMRRLQSIQNNAARLITGAPRRDHMHRYCDSFTGYQYDDVSTSRSPSWFSTASLVRHLVTWQRTVSSSPSISRNSATCPAPHVQHLRRPMHRSWRSEAMELAANQSKTASQSGTIQAFVKDIPV